MPSQVENKVLGKVADGLVKMGVGRPPKSKTQKKIDAGKLAQGASQEIVGVQTIHDGVIKTTDGRYIGVIEFEPVDYDQKPPATQEEIIAKFGSLFRNGASKCGIKVMNDRYSPNAFETNILTNCKDIQHREQALQNYLHHIEVTSASESITKRYFFIFQYEPDEDEDNYDTSFASIAMRMKEQKDQYANAMALCGNETIGHKDEDEFLAELCYECYNRETSKRESYKERKERIDKDIADYNRQTGDNKKATFADYLAPKGIYFDSRKYVYADGLYYGFIAIKGNNFPSVGDAGWCSFLNDGVADVDLDIRCQKLSKELARNALKIYNRTQKSEVYSAKRKDKDEKAEEVAQKWRNGVNIYQRLMSGDDIYNVEVILTIRAQTAKALADQIRLYKKTFREYMQFDDGYLNEEQYYKMTTAPLLFTTNVMNRLKHNMTSTVMGYMYPYRGIELNDIDGYMLGTKDNGALAIINNFNTRRYINGHCVIIGSSGAGKTYTEQTIGGRCCLNGMRVHFIIPAKGFEYENGCHLYGGSYIKLGPGMHDCINVLAIQPEDTVSDTGDIDAEAKKANQKSLLAKKVNSVVIWFQMLAPKGETVTQPVQNAIGNILVKLYNERGITDDNNSIYNEDGSIKDMPIIGELYNHMRKYSDSEESVNAEIRKCSAYLDPFVSGAYQNMNGQTNVDLDRDYTVYDVDENNIDKHLLASFLFLAFDCVYSKSKSNRNQRDIIILDELWKMLSIDACAEQIQNAILLARSYYTSIIVATQEIEAFLNSAGGYGISVLNNSELKFYMKTKELDMEKLVEHMKISPKDQEIIKSLSKGQVYMITSTEKIKITVSTTELEFEAYNTDHSKQTLNG